MRISDWSSDVCSSDLPADYAYDLLCRDDGAGFVGGFVACLADTVDDDDGLQAGPSMVLGKPVEIVDDGGRPGLDAAMVAIDRRVLADLALMEETEEHTSELKSLMRITYAVFCLKKKNNQDVHHQTAWNTTS